jgi:hypothetical protein
MCLCDFCSEPEVVWRYPARTFLAYALAGVVGQSVGDWAACPICHALIEAGDRKGLSERSLQTLLDKHPEMRSAASKLRQQIAGFHEMFFANRLGEAQAQAPDRQHVN